MFRYIRGFSWRLGDGVVVAAVIAFGVMRMPVTGDLTTAGAQCMGFPCTGTFSMPCAGFDFDCANLESPRCDNSLEEPAGNCEGALEFNKCSGQMTGCYSHQFQSECECL